MRNVFCPGSPRSGLGPTSWSGGRPAQGAWPARCPARRPHLGFPEGGGRTALSGFLRHVVSQQPLADQLLFPPRLPQLWRQRSRLSVAGAQSKPQTPQPQSPRLAAGTLLSPSPTATSPVLPRPPAPASRSRRRQRNSSTPQTTGLKRPCRRFHMAKLRDSNQKTPRTRPPGCLGKWQKLRSRRAERGKRGGARRGWD